MLGAGFFVTSVLVGGIVVAGGLAQSVVRTADPAKRGLKDSDFPRTIKITENVYAYEDFHFGDEKFTTTNPQGLRRARREIEMNHKEHKEHKDFVVFVGFVVR